MVVSAGCGDPTEGKPTASGTTAVTTAPSKSADADAGLWDPCSLPDSALSASGLDPSTKEKDVAGVDFEGWKVCDWRSTAQWYNLSIFSGTPTLQDVRKRPDYEAFAPLTVGTRQAVQYLSVNDKKRLNCYVAVELLRGTAIFKAQTNYSIGKQGDPCAEARRHTDELAKYLPGS
ncbi:DUF3558 domain-containing protein [Nocardia altamirensis]|uniref:DUF3558 domain-containing protein n=1 Tax=Nocardia altamirensis TaxID=472158 RepID=UPI000A045C92|nr:DUF3558 domain-containing protein [Nocardia altamirensis]